MASPRSEPAACSIATCATARLSTLKGTHGEIGLKFSEFPGAFRRAVRADGPMSHILDYARVSTDDQDVASQRTRLESAGAFRVFADVISGKTFD